MKGKPLKVLLEHRRMLRESGQDLLEIDTLITKMVKAIDYRIGLYTVHPEGNLYEEDYTKRKLNFLLANMGEDLLPDRTDRR